MTKFCKEQEGLFSEQNQITGLVFSFCKFHIILKPKTPHLLKKRKVGRKIKNYYAYEI